MTNYVARRRETGAASATSAPDPEQMRRDSEVVRLSRADRELRASLTEVLAASRALEQAARRTTPSAEDEEQLKVLRSRQSQLHTDLAGITSEIRDIRGVSS
jgi:hypothetical protein